MRIEDVESLEAALSVPGERTPEVISSLDGDLMVLGAGGKMGPTLARLLKNAAPEKTVYAVSRFSDPKAREQLDSKGVQTIAADLLDPSSYDGIPRSENVWYLAGMKFGASDDLPLTWAMNTYLPTVVLERFSASRIVAFSTGNVYPLVPIAAGGAREDTPPGPVGEYAQSCLGRERMFQHFSATRGTPVCLIRLNYANEPRYGIIVDLCTKILHGEPIDLSMGFVNLIWQGDANDYIARAMSLTTTPARTLNVTGPETVSVRSLAALLGGILEKEPVFVSEESDTALLSAAHECVRAFGYPRLSLLDMVEVIAEWVRSGNPLLGKPTKFQVRDGRF